MRSFFRFLTVLVVLWSSVLQAKEDISVEQQLTILIQSRDMLFERRYDEAESLLKNLIQESPDKLAGYFGLLALYQVRNFENYDYRFDPPYREWEKTGRDMAWKITRNESSSPWDLLMAGGTLGITGFYRGHHHKWLAAMKDSSTGFQAIKKSHEKDPQLTEALFGVGLYHYWRSHFTRKIKFLPFFDDRREQGKEELHRAARDGRFVDVLAKISLAYIDYQEKAYDKVLQTTDSLLERYPQNTILRMLKGDTLIQMKRYREASAEFDKILMIDRSITKCYLFKGVAIAREGKAPEEARRHVEQFLELEPNTPPDWRKVAEQTLKELDKKTSSAESDH